MRLVGPADLSQIPDSFSFASPLSERIRPWANPCADGLDEALLVRLGAPQLPVGFADGALRGSVTATVVRNLNDVCARRSPPRMALA